MGSIGDSYDNGHIKSFWARMQVELLNGRWWNTRLELANAIFDISSDLPQPPTTPQPITVSIMPNLWATRGGRFLFAKGTRKARLVVVGLAACTGIGAASSAPHATAATGSAFCAEAQTELTKLGTIAKSSGTAMSAKATPATLKAQLAPFLKTFRDSSSKLQKDAPANLRTAVKTYLDQGVKGIVALERVGWDIKKLPQHITDPTNFTTVIAPLVAYAKSTCGVVLLPMSQLSAEPSSSTTPTLSKTAAGELNVCPLLTLAEASAVAKNSVQAGKQRTGLTGATTCNFNFEAGNTPSVTVAVKRGRDYFDFLAGQGSKQPVTGVGDEAFTCDVCGGSNLVVSAKGSSLLVRVTRPAGIAPPTLADLKALAALVVSRLQ